MIRSQPGEPFLSVAAEAEAAAAAQENLENSSCLDSFCVQMGCISCIVMAISFSVKYLI